MLYWGIRECPHCGKPVDGTLGGLDRLTALFDQANRGAPEGVPMAISCPHCFGMIKLVLMPTVTVVALDKLQLAPLLLDEDDQPMTSPRKVTRRRKPVEAEA